MDKMYVNLVEAAAGALSPQLNPSPAARKDIENLFKKSMDAGISKGRTKQMLLYACVYLTCRNSKHNVPITYKDMGDTFKIYYPQKKLRPYLLDLKKQFNITTPLFNMYCFFRRFFYELCFPMHLYDESIEYIDINKSIMKPGKNPMSYLAVFLYFFAQHHRLPITQQMITDATGVSNVTLRYYIQENKNLIKYVEGGQTNE